MFISLIMIMSQPLELPPLLSLQIPSEQKSIINITMRATLQQIRIACIKNFQMLKVLQNRISIIIGQIANCHKMLPDLIKRELEWSSVGRQVDHLRTKTRLISEYSAQLVHCDKAYFNKFEQLLNPAKSAQGFLGNRKNENTQVETAFQKNSKNNEDNKKDIKDKNQNKQNEFSKKKDKQEIQQSVSDEPSSNNNNGWRTGQGKKLDSNWYEQYEQQPQNQQIQQEEEEQQQTEYEQKMEFKGNKKYQQDDSN